MRICYHCDHCGAAAGALTVDFVDEHRLGFDCLTSEERADIIRMDVHADMMHVKSLCDRCAARLTADADAIQNYMVH